jgi:hypothetical protein
MRAKRLMLSAVTRRNRHDAMAEINDAVIGAGGWVEGHTLFSNIATTFRTELPMEKIADFVRAIDSLGVHLDTESKHAVALQEAPGNRRDADVPVTLNVTFIHDEPDLRREVPMVPG